MNLKAPRLIDIEWIANGRVSLFYIAPTSGIMVCFLAVYLYDRAVFLNENILYYDGYLGLITLMGIITSGVVLVMTDRACKVTIIARGLAHPVLPGTFAGINQSILAQHIGPAREFI